MVSQDAIKPWNVEWFDTEWRFYFQVTQKFKVWLFTANEHPLW